MANAQRRAQREAWFNDLVRLGMNPGAAGNVANMSDFNAARNAYNHAYGVHTAANERARQQKMRDDMIRRQNELLRAAQNTPKTNQALRGREYTPKFRASVSNSEAKRAVSKGTYQFANQLAMGLGGSGFGGGTGPNLGG